MLFAFAGEEKRKAAPWTIRMCPMCVAEVVAKMGAEGIEVITKELCCVDLVERSRDE